MQAKIQSYQHSASRAHSIVNDRGSPPDDHELADTIAPNWAYDFDVEAVDGITKLRKRIRDAEYAINRVEAWSHILGDYLSYRNAKIAPEVAIFNMGAANDCENYGTEYCQVDAEDGECFAARNENDFPKPIHFRRKQAIVWSLLDPITWAKAFRKHAERKNNDVTAIRLNEAGDFSSQHDILRVTEIARELTEFDIYTYSASSWLDWDDADHFTINQSNDGNYGHRRYKVVKYEMQIPDGPNAVLCPYDKTGGEIQCGECQLCLNETGPNVYVLKNYGSNG